MFSIFTLLGNRSPELFHFVFLQFLRRYKHKALIPNYIILYIFKEYNESYLSQHGGRSKKTFFLLKTKKEVWETPRSMITLFQFKCLRNQPSPFFLCGLIVLSGLCWRWQRYLFFFFWKSRARGKHSSFPTWNQNFLFNNRYNRNTILPLNYFSKYFQIHYPIFEAPLGSTKVKFPFKSHMMARFDRFYVHHSSQCCWSLAP